MEFTETYFSFEPYICTQWDAVEGLSVQKHPSEDFESLTFHLKNGDHIYLPELDTQKIDEIFKAYRQTLQIKSQADKPQEQELSTHAKQLKSILKKSYQKILNPLLSTSNPLQEHIVLIGDTEQQDLLLPPTQTLLKHDPLAQNTPKLPKELLRKIRAMSRNLLAKTDDLHTPQAHGNCNCLHCQVARAIEEGIEANEEKIGEEISDKDLHFSSWQIQSAGEERFSLSNPQNPIETYIVELKPQLSCTCGEDKCEHIAIVLREC